jgi:hypothetical protein
MTTFRGLNLRTLKILVPCLSACLLPCLSATPAWAGEAPRWDIVSFASPTNLAPNTPTNEVQQLTVDATGGTFTLSFPKTQGVCDGSGPTAPLPFNATAAEVQAALAALPECINESNVTVTGGPGSASPYVVTFIGSLKAFPLPLLSADSSSLTGGTATAKLSETTRGATAPYLLVKATNVGGAATDGSTVTINDVLPAALSATSISGYDAYASGYVAGSFGTASCTTSPGISCSYSGVIDPGDTLVMRVNLQTAATSLMPEELNVAQVSGGGAAQAAISTPITLGVIPAPFGPAPGSVSAALSTSQAGAHANVTTAFALSGDAPSVATGDVRDVHFDLPPGLVGNTVGMPTCSMAAILKATREPSTCPSDTMVGMAILTFVTERGSARETTVVTPVYNISPAPGEPAAFAFNAVFLPVRLDTSVLSDGNFAVRVSASGLTQAAVTLATSITIWGVPADHSGPGNDQSYYKVLHPEGTPTFGGASGQTRVPLLSNPQHCSTPLSAELSVDSWSKPGHFVSSGVVPMGTLTGCDQLSLESSFSMLPDTLEAGAPAGYAFDLNVPQRNEPDGLATPNVKDVKLTLPAGVVVNPSAAWGLKACSDAQFFGPNRGKQEPATLSECPREAQVGKVTVKSPALEEALAGQVYLGEPECNPCTPRDAQDGKMVRLFLQVVSAGEGGIVVKLEGHGSINQATGQITTVFENNPQLPFSSLKLDLGGGPRAVLANPRACGAATSNLDLTPWSTPFSADSTPNYSFEVNQGCFGPQFNPSFVAGVTNLQAGEYGPFTLSFGRGDHDQFLGGLELHMPPGLSGTLAHVPLCAEPQAAQGTCPQQSLIGHTQVLTGPGADPFLVTGGQVFLTEGYKGAPFGLSIVVPAVAGPYTLSGTTGHGTVVVRAAISIDPHTAALTVRSDPLPSVLDGIPLQLKVVNVTIDRNEFTFAPTSCAKMQVAGTLASTEGASAPVASPFQVTNCAALAFKPKFSAGTSSKDSFNGKGASLTVRVATAQGPSASTAAAGEANISSVKVELPKSLPSRLPTLQKACTAAQFNANPAGCPAASMIGAATVHTPILPVPLTGPAIFVSHGGEAFPSLVLVLQGYGVNVTLVGETFISKAGITSSTFKTVPDQPFTAFELSLPAGKYSALAATTKVCKPTKSEAVRRRVTRRVHGKVRKITEWVTKSVAAPLVMPTEITAQNGAVLRQNTVIAVEGCPKAKRHKAKKAARRPSKQRRH